MIDREYDKYEKIDEAAREGKSEAVASLLYRKIIFRFFSKILLRMP